MSVRRSRGGFTLVEILVSTTVLLLIGGILATFVVQAFRLWERGARRLERLGADDEWTERLERDFASAVGPRGLKGDRSGCVFVTLLRLGPEAEACATVTYRFEDGAVERAVVPYPAGPETRERFAPARDVALMYAGPADPAGTWRESWSSPTNAPTRLRCVRHPGEGRVWSGLLARRTP